MALPVPASSFLLLIATGLIILDPMAHTGETQCRGIQPDASSPTPLASHEDSSVIDLSTELQRVKAQLIDLEESLAMKDLALQEKQQNIISLEGDLGTHKKDGGGDIAAAIDHAQEQLKVLESKVFQVESELHTKLSKLVELKHRVKVLEAAEAERNMKGQQLEKLIAEQKSLVEKEKVEHTLHAAEATLVRVQKEADAHRGWFPVWASYRLVQIQGSMGDYYDKHAQHYWDTASEKVSVVKSLVHKWSRHHAYSVNVAHQTWVRVLKHLLSSLNPHVEEAQSRAAGAYEAIKEFCTQQLETVRSVLEPHVQVAKETGRPYIEAVAGYARPKVEQVQGVIRPYFEKALYNYKSFLTLTTNYHSQLQTSVKGRLKRVDFLDSMASKERVWFLASMLLMLPIFAIFIIFFPIFRSNKAMKPMKGHHHGHGHKKTKRAKQADK